MNKATKLLIVLSFFFRIVLAQEHLTELQYNTILKTEHLKYAGASLRASPDTVNLPFLDDFSFSNIYPHDSLWLDDDVLVNKNYPVNPPTLGVATFDGLDYKGDPYSPNQPNSYGVADYLTSKPINLDYLPFDSVFLSFFYQAQGIGETPDPKDSLVLEFFSVSDSAWQWKWSVPGSSVQDFNAVIIPVTDTVYLKKGFQFRFKNYATLSGSFDHWHVDYVWLGKNRSVTKVTPDPDVAFTYLSNPMLKNYRQMPWHQFKANPAAEMNDSLIVRLRNNSSDPKVVSYQYKIYDNNTNPGSTSSGNVDAMSNTSFRNKLNYIFPTSSTAYYEIFLIENIVTTLGDLVNSNDTIRFTQQFDHDYAYDDASSEAGYGLTAYGAKIAYRFKLNTPDQLTAIAMHFTQMNVNVSIYPFKITVWDNGINNKPGNIIHQESGFSYPVYNTVNGFHIYELTNAVNVTGTFYVGFVQNNNVELNIGFDKNTDASANMFFNTDGAWFNTQFSGAWMMRPVLGTPGLPIGIKENKENLFSELKIYPNPAKEVFYVDGISEWKNKTVSIYDIYGKMVMKINSPPSNTFYTSGFSHGVYIVKITDVKTGNNSVNKIIVSR